MKLARNLTLHGSHCFSWWQKTSKGLRGVEAHSKVLNIKAMNDRISVDFLKPSLISRIKSNLRTTHLMAMENTVTSTQKLTSRLKGFALEICLVRITNRDCLISRDQRERKRKQRIKYREYDYDSLSFC